jgi:murein DD-endopeptidase MepM/ murein hydrolase activator NlpD
MLKVLLLLTSISISGFAENYFLDLKGEPVQGGLIIARTNPSAVVTINKEPVGLNKDGYFMFGFGRFDDQNIELDIQFNNYHFKTTVPVIAREFPTEVIDGLPESKVNPPAEVYAQIKSDNIKVAEARAFYDQRDDFLQDFIWPSSGRVSGVYGSRRILNGEAKRPHYGMDIANVVGTDVVAPASGVVRLAETDMYYTGGTIIIDHGYGLTTTFMHLSQLNVKVGDYINQSEKIGEIGATGRATGPHLDWRLNLGNTRLDPQLIISKIPNSMQRK